MPANLVGSFDALQTPDALGAFAKVYPISGGPLTTGFVVTVQADGTLKFQASGAGSSTLASDTDVAITTPADRNLLIFHSSDSKWHNDTLVAGDIPSLDASKITTGQLAAARGGTGVDASAAANGKTLIGNGSGFTLAALTAGTGITITNAAGQITIAAAGGTGPGGSVPYWVTKSPFTTGTAGAKDEFWDDTSNMSGPVNGLDASWTEAGNSPPAERVFSDGRCHVAISNASANKAWILYKTAPSTPWTITVPVWINSLTNYNPCGPMARASSSGKFIALAVLQNAATPTDFELQLERYTSPTGRSTFSSASGNFGCERLFWLRINYDGTTFTFSYALGGAGGRGAQWHQWATEAKSSFFGTDTIDGVGLYLDSLTTNAPGFYASFGPVIFT